MVRPTADSPLQNAEVDFNSLNELLLSLRDNYSDYNLINEIFRLIHSIKTRASFLQLEKAEKIAHKIETLLERLRKGEWKADEELIDSLSLAISDLQKIFPLEGRDDYEGDAEEEKRLNLVGEKVVFNNFEIQLLKEARERGEKFYKMVCELEPDAPMKYPRVYLIINNLELMVNVIKVIPPLDPNEIESLEELIIYFTTSESESTIYNAVNIDELRRVDLVGLEATSYLAGKEVTSAPVKSTETTEIEAYADRTTEIQVGLSKIEDLLRYNEEIRLHVESIEKNLKELPQNIQTVVRQIGELSLQTENILLDIQLIPLEREFKRLSAFVSRIAGKAGKKIRFISSGGNLKVDRRVLDSLSDSLLHLVRNAVDHGIEYPGDRMRSGKSEEGTVAVSVVAKENSVIFQVIDDGKGILKDRVLEKARSLNIYLPEDKKEDLLFIISRPGFSIKESATSLSGMGVGLDLVSQRIGQIKGGELRLTTVEGEGSIFTLVLPLVSELIYLMMFRSGNITFSLPKRNIKKTFPVANASFKKGEDGSLCYHDHPVFNLKGKLIMDKELVSEKFAVLVEHLGRERCLVVDEILFEKQFPKGAFVLDEEISPYLYSIKIGDKRADFFYLNPSIIIQ